MAGLGYTIALIDIFLRSSRILDVAAPGLRIPLIVMAVGTLLAVATGRFMEPLTSRLGLLLLGLTAFMIVGGAVGVWPGGTVGFLKQRWLPMLPVFFVAGSFLRSEKQLRRGVGLLGIGFLLAASLTLVMGKETGFKRMSADMTYGNSNDLAMIVVFAAPLAMWIALDRTFNPLFRLGTLGLLAASAVVFVRTGSRAGILTVAILLVYLSFRLSMRARIRLFLACALIVPLGLALTPRYILDRYATLAAAFFDPPDPIADEASMDGEERPDYRNVNSAIGSTEGRFELLKRSLEVTFENPIFGVGAGMFVVAENELAVQMGQRRGHWQVSHNMYTQVSSETGLVGFGLWFSLLLTVWRTFGRAEKLDPRTSPLARQLRSMGFPLKLSTLVFMVFGLTLSIAFSFFLVVLAAFALRMDILMRSLRTAATASPGLRPALPAPARDRSAEAVAAPAVRRQIGLPGAIG